MMKAVNLLAAGLLFVTACVPTDIDEDDELTRNMLQWDSRRPEVYEIVTERACECTTEMQIPVRLLVNGGQLVSVRDEESDEIVDEPPYHAMTVNGLFAVIREALEDNAYRLSVTYDPEYGYPRHIFINPDREGVDDEMVITARNFRAVPSVDATKRTN